MLTDLGWRLSLAAASLAACIFAGCDCPEGFTDHVELRIAPGPVGDQVWTLTSTTRGDGNCVLQLTEGEVTRVGGEPCPRPRLVDAADYTVAIVGRPDQMDLTLSTDTGVVERTVEPTYRAWYGGGLCGEVLVGTAELVH